ncbi:hypothetical protein [Peribacillus frigoritolerans]|uniref:hypothetical protein n=1 Tax=Peribacillus frigoritolerans TaxID=450367 RepID=UPI00315CDD37
MIKLKYFGRSDSVLLVHYCEVVHLNERVISSYRELIISNLYLRGDFELKISNIWI